MAINNNYLLRGNLQETRSHIRTSCYSPDIIGHKQVADPVDFFLKNYNKDPNEGVDTSRQFNTVYVRAKNIADSGVSNDGYVHLYQCGYSLFMKPSEWMQDQMRTLNGNDYVLLQSSVADEIAVGVDCFQVSNKNDAKYCLAAVISDSPDAHIPDDFRDADEYVHWVMTNPGVTFRNLRTIWNYKKTTYEQIMRIEGSGSEELAMFYMTCKNIPHGTKIRMECSAIELDVSAAYDGNPLHDVKIVPASLDTYLIMSAITPDGKWPAGADLHVDYYTAVREGALSYQYSVTPMELSVHESPVLMSSLQEFAGPSGHLVLTGSCGTVFI